MLSALIDTKIDLTKINAIYTISFTSYFGKTKISNNQGLSIFYNVNYDLFQCLKIMLRFPSKRDHVISIIVFNSKTKSNSQWKLKCIILAVQELSETRQSQKQDITTDPWEYTVMKFAANLNLKEHQFFLLMLYNPKCYHENKASSIPMGI